MAAYEIPGFARTSPSGADFTGAAAGQHRLVAMNASGQVVNPAAGARCVGVRSNKPNTGQATSVCTSGIVWIEGGAAISIDDAIAADAAGKALVATVGQAIIGRAVTAGAADGSIVSVELSTEQVLSL